MILYGRKKFLPYFSVLNDRLSYYCFFILFLLLQEKNQKKQAKGMLSQLLSSALRAAFGGCALHAPAGAAAIEAAPFGNPRPASP